MTEERAGALFRGHRLPPGPDLAARLRELVRDPGVRRTFGLDPD